MTNLNPLGWLKKLLFIALHFEIFKLGMNYETIKIWDMKITFFRLPVTLNSLRSDLPTLKSTEVTPPSAWRTTWVGARPITHKLCLSPQNHTTRHTQNKWTQFSCIFDPIKPILQTIINQRMGSKRIQRQPQERGRYRNNIPISMTIHILIVARLHEI